MKSLNYRYGAALRGLASAAAVSGVVLGLGLFGASRMDGDSFADLGLLAITLVFFAPLGAVVGAYLGLVMFGTSERPAFGMGSVLVPPGIGLTLYLSSGIPFAIAGILIGIAMVIAFRTGLGPSVDDRRQETASV